MLYPLEFPMTFPRVDVNLFWYHTVCVGYAKDLQH